MKKKLRSHIIFDKKKMKRFYLNMNINSESNRRLFNISVGGSFLNDFTHIGRF